MKTLYLHIGCGKTGSSALQVWLWNNHGAFRDAGVLYPVEEGVSLGDYSITSGNGGVLFHSLRRGHLRELLTSLPVSEMRGVLFSSEIFQLLNEVEISELRDVAKACGFQLKVLAYVRDIYDMAYSSYAQLIKRNGYSRTFPEYVDSLLTMQQFDVVRRYVAALDDVAVVHYDTARKEGLDKSFLRFLDLSLDLPLPGTKVNRSISMEEMEVVRLFNSVAGRHGLDRKLVNRVSDLLIARDPEKPSEIFFNKNLEQTLSSRFGDDITSLNTYVRNGSVRVFDPEGKALRTQMPELSPAMRKSLVAVFDVLVGSLAVGSVG